MPPFHHGFDFDPGSGGLIPLIGSILWIALLAILVWSLIRWLTERNTPPMFWYRTTPPPPPMYQPSALEILRQRYARGEIDDETFQQMRERIEASTPPGQQRPL